MRLYVGIAIGVVLGVGAMALVPRGAPPVALAGDTPSGNGDVNASGTIDIADAIYLLSYLFAKGPAPEPVGCADCCLPCPPPMLPATGQTKCYRGDAPYDEVACTDPEFPGQDGYFQRGCPADSRFVENGDGTVTDNCTGLMWQKETPQARYAWGQALQYCAGLELAGYHDWRLPNVRELQSLVDYGRNEPSIAPFFGTEPFQYWSSSVFVADPDFAWLVGFAAGNVDEGHTDYDFNVRAVRD